MYLVTIEEWSSKSSRNMFVLDGKYDVEGSWWVRNHADSNVADNSDDITSNDSEDIVSALIIDTSLHYRFL